MLIGFNVSNYKNNLEHRKNNADSKKLCFTGANTVSHDYQVGDSLHFSVNSGLKTESVIKSGVNTGFPESDIQEIIDKCTYGKTDLISNPENFHVKLDGEKVILQNWNKNESDSYTGTCSELCKKIGEKLQKQYGKNYIFGVIVGHYPKYNINHYYLFALKNTGKNLEKFNHMLNGEIDDFSFTGSSLIDPSFGICEKYEKQDKFKNHCMSKIKKIEDINIYQYPDQGTLLKDRESFPLGFNKDMPDLISDLPPDALLGIRFFRNEQSGKVEPELVQLGNYTAKSVNDMEKALSSDHSLKKFFNKIRKDLEQQQM